MPVSVTSRRAVFATLAGAALSSTALLRAAAGRRQSLVSIRLAHGADGQAMVQSGLLGPDWSGSLGYVHGQFDRGAAAVVEEQFAHAAERGYLPDGFSVPAWMLRASGASLFDSAGRAFTFSSGLVLFTPDGLASEGSAYAQLLGEAGSHYYDMPKTAIGRQLSQVAGLLTARPATRMMFSVSLGGPVIIGDAAKQSAARLRDLDETLAAFEHALQGSGIASDVTVVTDADATVHGRASRLILGGAVADGTIPGGTIHESAASEHAGAMLARWAGYASLPLPGFPASVRGSLS